MTVWCTYVVKRYEDCTYNGRFGVNKYTCNGKYKTTKDYRIEIKDDNYLPICDSFHAFNGLKLQGNKVRVAVRHIKPCKGSPWNGPHMVFLSFIFDKDSSEETSASYKRSGKQFAQKVFERYIDRYNKKHKTKLTYNLIPYKEVDGKRKYIKDKDFVF